MEPEIARRCLDCGASVRGNAVFCPQCGKALKAGAAAANVGPAIEIAPEMPALRKTDPGVSAQTVRLPESATPPASEMAATLPAAEDNLARTIAGDSHQQAEAVRPRAMNDDGERSKRQRMTAAARDVVGEKISPRVEKLRQASNVMLEEAAYDPSLRFVLVALGLILISLLLLLLNYLLR